MTVEELINRLELIAGATPGAVVMLRRGDENWFDEIEDVSICRINGGHDGLNCGADGDETGGNGEVIVIR